MIPLQPASVRTHADLYDDLTSPARRDSYPRDSRAYVCIDMSIRSYWHNLFDAVPQLLDLSGPDGRAIFLPFMLWANENGLSLNWTYHLWVCEWLLTSEFRDRLDEDLIVKMMAASAGRWTREMTPTQCGLVLGSRSIGDKAVVGWKLDSIKITHFNIGQVEFDEPLPSPSGNFGFFTTPSFELDCFPGWGPIPR